MLSLLTNYFLHSGAGNESKIALFTEIPFQEGATRGLLNTAFRVPASLTELQMEIDNHNTIQSVPNADLYKHYFISIVSIFIRRRILDIF